MIALCGGGDSAARLSVLSRLVVDLLVEVEALSGALAASHAGAASGPTHQGYDTPCHDEALTDGEGAYPGAYVDAAYVLHNAAGPTGGVEKLLARFYPDGAAGPREALMLRRLGFSEAEIDRFVAAAEQAGQFS